METHVQFVLNNIPVPALLVDDSARVVSCNANYSQLTAGKLSCIGRSIFSLFSLNSKHISPRNFMKDAPLQNKEPIHAALIASDESPQIHVELNWKKLTTSEKDYWIFIMYPVDNLIREVEQLRFQASRDELTGIYNRRAFNVNFDKEVKRAKRYNSIMALILIDLDYFKQVNDTFGHHKGDQLLVALTENVAKILRDCDTFARVGGDEFAVLMPQTTLEQANQAANRIRETANQAFLEVDTKQVKASISLGVASAHGKFVNKKALMRLADDALYKAKNSGRNLVQVSVLTAA